MPSVNKILFISHSASLSGAPLVLLNFAFWLKKNKPDVLIDVILMQPGEYVDKFSAIFDNMFIFNKDQNPTIISRVIRYGKSYIGFSDEELLIRKISSNHYNLIYCNTALTLGLGVKIKNKLRVENLLLHVHELHINVKILAPSFKAHSVYVDKFIGVSQSVVDMLIETYAIDSNKIKLVYEFINLEDHSKADKQSMPYFKVGAAGYFYWRKGYDLFLLTASLFRKRYPEIAIKFQWVGDGDKLAKIIIEEEINKLGLNGIVEFSGQTITPFDEFKQFDLFLLLSREDPFPLVCLEVASLGIPIIGFNKSGGVSELLSGIDGPLVPYQDIEEVVNQIYDYYNNIEKRVKDGRQLKERAVMYSTNNLAPKIYSFIES